MVSSAGFVHKTIIGFDFSGVRNSGCGTVDRRSRRNVSAELQTVTAIFINVSFISYPELSAFIWLVVWMGFPVGLQLFAFIKPSEMF